MSLPAWLRAVLPGDTAATWERFHSVVPDVAYLVGGTAIAVHLRHRVSRNLDFFLAEVTDLDVLRQQLEAIGRLAVTLHTEDTLNGLFNRTRTQFLSAVDQRILEPLTEVEGIRIAGIGDLLAMKLKVIGDRGELSRSGPVSWLRRRACCTTPVRLRVRGRTGCWPSRAPTMRWGVITRRWGRGCW